ncbi:MAG: response regulator transcription factor [Campylobacterales bacterium]|nr:response regulator transcription factor [Campylobacterales bacterium]
MQLIFFSSNIDMIDEWQKRHDIEHYISCYDLESLMKKLESNDGYIIIADYDTMASEINKLISSNKIPKKLIVLECSPAIATGKMLISKGIRAYGNSRMLKVHYVQMLRTVLHSKIWTYPELTAALAKNDKKLLNEDAWELLVDRLTEKEIEVVELILKGFTNDGISLELNITTRTVKAHISSIFSKLHVNDRLALVLLLKQ